SLVAAAKALPASKRELAALKEFNGRASRTELDRWWHAIESGRARTDVPSLRSAGDTIPPARAWSARNPEADARLKTARARITELSEQVHIPVENLLTPEFLRMVAWNPPEPLDVPAVAESLRQAGARTWQIDVTAQLIHDAFVDAAQTMN